MTVPRYCELHAHTAFSFLEGASQPEELVEAAMRLGLPALAVTDRGGLYGAPRVHKAAVQAGVEALVGTEVMLADGARLPLLVVDARGYSNLCRMLTTAALEGPAGAATRKCRRSDPVVAPAIDPETSASVPLARLMSNPLALPGDFRSATDRVAHCSAVTAPRAAPGPRKGEGRGDWDLVAGHAAGLIALTGGEAGPLVRAWRRGGEDAATAELRRLIDIFGGDRVAVEVQRHHLRGEEARNAVLVALARAAGVPVVATQDALIGTASDGPVADVFTCLRAHCTLDGAGRRLALSRARRLRSPQEMARLFADLPEAVAASARIATTCSFRLTDLPYRFPAAKLEAGRDENAELRARVETGARERYGEPTQRVRAQLERELALIAKLGLPGYFLVVHDIIRFCRARGILAQGRGSAANSAVCYALAITNVDPIAFDLLFERFLSEERGEWPDIDIDLPSGARREEVIQHVFATYGTRGAAMTANVITYRGRSAVREVGKVLGFSEEHLGRLARLVGHWGFSVDPRSELPAILREAGLDPGERHAGLFVELVTRILHLPRHLGQHSGGMVLARGRLDDVVPLEPAAMPGRRVIQWDKDDCADLGIIKVDLLGLGMLAALEEAVPLIRRHEGVAVDLAHLPQDDPAVYEMITRADTVGVFQIESRAQMATLPRMRPRRFYDLVVEVALIRPGPIVGKMVHPYLNRRLGREKVSYPHPDLERVLARTLGVPLFQEQLMRVSMIAAGFTGGQAEELRRAMTAKRSVERMQKVEANLRAGMAARGITGGAADDIVQGITSFALYGFPESHAASFALIAYASAYLKVHHPAAFLCALLNAWPMGFYHPATLIQDARRHGVRVLPIDVTHSDWRCRLERGPAQRGSECHPGASATQRGNTRRAGPEVVEPNSDRWTQSSAAVPESERHDSAGVATTEDPAGYGPDGTKRGELVVRLGLRFVSGLREEAARRIVGEAQARRFTSVREVARRCGLRNDELEKLAVVGAFAALGETRRAALWQVAALDGRRPPLAQAMQPDPGASPLPEMSLVERYVADYEGASVTVGRHPLALRRAELAARGILSAAELTRARDGSRVRAAGVVIVRQRPATAKGMCFATMEDESGFANLAITPDRFAAQRAVITTHALLEVEGVVQNRDGVVTLLAETCRPLFVVVPANPSRDFH